MTSIDFDGHCHRCGGWTKTTAMSIFDAAILCGICVVAERAHPDYPRAAEGWLAAAKRGELNFPGIGKPDNL